MTNIEKLKAARKALADYIDDWRDGASDSSIEALQGLDEVIANLENAGYPEK